MTQGKIMLSKHARKLSNLTFIYKVLLRTYLAKKSYLIFYYFRHVSKIRQKLRHEKQEIITRTFQLRNFKGTFYLQWYHMCIYSFTVCLNIQ